MINIEKLYEVNKSSSEYYNSNKNSNKVEEKLANSKTLYIGNLSFYTTESKIFNIFSQFGIVSRVIMGLNRNTMEPCGFCFVEYYCRNSAQKAVFYLNNSKIDCRTIRVDWDIGFEEGRQYGRGLTGGQKRDEFNNKDDPDRPKIEKSNFNNYSYKKSGFYQNKDTYINKKRNYN